MMQKQNLDFKVGYSHCKYVLGLFYTIEYPERFHYNTFDWSLEI